MAYLIVGVALLATLFLFIESRLRRPRRYEARGGRQAAPRRRVQPLAKRGRAHLRLLPPSAPRAQRRAHG